MKFYSISACLLLLSASISLAQTVKEVQLNEVQSTAARFSLPTANVARTIQIITADDIRKSAVKTIDDALELALGVDVRSRGPFGVQSDISTAGGSFEQTLILVNGIPMTDPQTGHHMMNLPITLDQIDHIEVVQGGASRVFGAKAFTGAINIITKKVEDNSAAVQIAGGEYGYYNVQGSASVKLNSTGLMMSAQKAASDGYITNTDFDNRNYSAQWSGKVKSISFNVMGGINHKAFGAQNFYTSAFPTQFEETQSRMASASLAYDKEKLSVRAAGYYRRHFDRFELYREGDDWYKRVGNLFIMGTDTAPSWYTGHNYHRTDVQGGNLNIAYRLKSHLISIGGDMRHEEVLSNVLGENLSSTVQAAGEPVYAKYTKGTSRDEMNLYVEDQITYNRWMVSAGLMTAITSDYGTRLFPGADLSFKWFSNVRLYANVNTAVRYPTFTDLYYNRGGAVGSKDLKPETSLNYEGGFRYFNGPLSAQVAVFRREAKSLIDWIRVNGETTTKAANITEVNFTGVNASFLVDFKKMPSTNFVFTSLRINYSYVVADTASNNFESNYVLDYLKHKLSVIATQELAGSWTLNWTVNYQDREGGYVKTGASNETAYPAFYTLDGRVKKSTRFADVYVDVNNIFNAKYEDLGNIEQPGRVISAGVAFRIN
jgi:iron complex outermembrane receptor protein